MVMKHKGSLEVTKDLTVDNSMTVAGLVYPTSDGTLNQAITTDGAGTLTFATVSGTAMTVEEIDGVPSVLNVGKMKFTNGTVTDDGGGVVTINVAAAGGGGGVEPRLVGQVAKLLGNW